VHQTQKLKMAQYTVYKQNLIQTDLTKVFIVYDELRIVNRNISHLIKALYGNIRKILNEKAYLLEAAKRYHKDKNNICLCYEEI